MDGAGEALASRLLQRCTFSASSDAGPVPLAVSGGADSLALLALAALAGLEVVAYHVDHGLRPESAAEATVVAEAARRFGAGYVPLRVELEAGANLEARARTARLAVLPAGAATGHTADDQAETVLLNLLRGAGPSGLAGMRPGAAHPILGLRRQETHHLCQALSLQPVHDASNDDVSLLRNRVRHEVLPALAAAARRDLVPVLARQAEIFAAEADFLDELAGALDPTDAKALAGAPPVLARRAARRWLRSRDPEGHPPSAASVERVLAVARGEALACEVEGGIAVRRTGGRLRMEGGRGR